MHVSGIMLQMSFVTCLELSEVIRQKRDTSLKIILAKSELVKLMIVLKLLLNQNS